MGSGWDVGNPPRGSFHPLPDMAGKSFPLHAGRDGVTQGCRGAQGRIPGTPAQAAVCGGASGPAPSVCPCPSPRAGLAFISGASAAPPARRALSPRPLSFLLGRAVLPAAIAQWPSRRREMGEDVLNGGVGEACAGCLRTPGTGRGPSTHPYPIFLPRPPRRCGFRALWVPCSPCGSVIRERAADKPSGAQRASLETQSETLRLAVLPPSSVVTGLGHVGKNMECFSFFPPIICFYFKSCWCSAASLQIPDLKLETGKW